MAEIEARTCFLRCNSTAPVLSFTAETLATCLKTLQRRKKHGLKYADIVLPEEVQDSIGYHSKCRNNFNALKAQFRGVCS